MSVSLKSGKTPHPGRHWQAAAEVRSPTLTDEFAGHGAQVTAGENDGSPARSIATAAGL